MTFRFEEEDYRTTYVLEDFYFTNPFSEEEFLVISFRDQDDAERRFSFILNFDRTQRSLPNTPKLSKVESAIIKNFVKDMPDELLVLFKQRAAEAKAYGEKNPMSYLEFTPDRYVNYIEMHPSNKETIKFTYAEDKYFAEDSYNTDPREKNRDLKLAFYRMDLNDSGEPPVFEYTYYFEEKLRAEEDARLDPVHNDMIMAMNAALPDLYDILKKRYRTAKDVGEKLMQSSPSKIVHVDEKAESGQVLN
ncbi:MAG: hypothetical protein G3M78_06565 [Candidatus Nitrohelix vancouverensis]|uniref:Uncharacterized protein n=1 Tax=Candidatus Nitrohelix vancouverensis TaxID=2705534 RepID=A0A7T0C229_9BACT|nr:MAG: hypothetical protein G3M78_06565 [Candidatus Nitrohelix vancouverensis]